MLEVMLLRFCCLGRFAGSPPENMCLCVQSRIGSTGETAHVAHKLPETGGAEPPLELGDDATDVGPGVIHLGTQASDRRLNKKD